VLRRSAVAVGIGLFVGISLFWALVLVSHGLVGNDGLVYRAGASALIGGDPWAATVHGYSYSAPPLEAVAFLPAVSIPEQAFQVLWVVVCLASAVAIVKSLELPAYWIVYPPLVFGALLGNPAIPGMALLLVGFPLAGLVLRPQLVLVTGTTTLFWFVVLSTLGLLLRPDFVAALSTGASRYVSETGGIVNWWATLLAIPAALALLMLARVDARAARWLIAPAIGPAMGWYGFTMVMPVRSLTLAVLCAIPLPGVGAAAITGYSVLRYLRDSPTESRVGRLRGHWRRDRRTTSGPRVVTSPEVAAPATPPPG
jgi:hypothetical protein